MIGERSVQVFQENLEAPEVGLHLTVEMEANRGIVLIAYCL